jgi:hypothetical protein
MSLYNATDQVKDDPATQALLRSWQVGLVRIPMRQSLDDAALTAALQAVRTIGATPLVIVNGPGELAGDSAILARDQHDLALVENVFPNAPVDLEYGNEDDLNHATTATQYTASWNAVVSQLRAQAPASYKWVGPVNYQSNPGYVATFVAGANPRPDYISWHEYVCQASDTSTCTSHIANWATHAQNTNTAEQNAIGITIPFLITEWNVDPSDGTADEALYGNAAFIQPWTAAAITELRSLTSLGLAGALIYTASNHGNFALLKAGPTLTPQGQTFAQQATASPSPSTNPSPSPSPSPTTSPTGTATTVDFEDGTDGWSGFWGSPTVATTTQEAFHDTQSLEMATTGASYSAVGTTRSVGTLAAGAQVTFHIYATGQTGGIRPFVQNGAYQTVFAQATDTPLPSQPGWIAVTWTVPAVTTVHAVGLQLANPDPDTTLTIPLDDLTW